MPFAIEPSTEIANRIDFAHLANARGYVDAVEVGVDQGIFARDFLARWQGHWLMLVDPYEPYPEMPYDRAIDSVVAASALAAFHGRFRFIKDRSPDAIPHVLRCIKAPQFVYIDGAHTEQACLTDMVAWWAVLAEGGMLAGHDYDEPHPGVRAAVERFARELGLVVRLTHETDFPPSWYCYKGEPAKLIYRFFRHGEGDNPHHV